MGSAPLQGAELYGPGLAADLMVDQVGQVSGGACQLLVAKSIDIVGAAACLADIGAVRQADSF